MSLLKAWFINIVLLGLAFLFLPWSIWNPLATLNIIGWLVIVLVARLKGKWHLPLSLSWKIAGSLLLTSIGFVLLIDLAPSAIWLYFIGHAFAIALSRND